MSEFTKGYQWSQAAAKGLILALITIACNTVTYLLPDKAFVNILMFVVRTVASIWLLVTFMKQYAATTGQSPMGFAVCTVLLSSLVCGILRCRRHGVDFPRPAGPGERGGIPVYERRPCRGYEHF